MRRLIIRVGIAAWLLLALVFLSRAVLPPPNRGTPNDMAEFLVSHLEFVATQARLEPTERARADRIRDLTRPLLIRAHVYATRESVPRDRIAVPMGDGTWLAARPPSRTPPLWRRLLPPFALLTAVGVTGLWVSRRFLADLGRVEAAVSAIRQEDMSVRIATVGPAVQPLAEAINQLVARVEGLVSRQTELLQAVSHELRTPLTRLELELEALSGDLAEGALRGAHEEVDTLDRLISELATWMRVGSSPAARVPFSLAPCVASAVQRVAVLGPHVTVSHDSDEASVVAGEPDVARILDNALGNAVRHAKTTVWLRATVADDGGLTVAVHDDGPGFPSDPTRLLAPFVKGEAPEAGGGSGLGLSIIHRIVDRYQGSVELTTSPMLGGACLIVHLVTGLGSDDRRRR